MRHSIEHFEIAARPTSQLSFQHLIKLVKSIHFFKEIMCYTSKPRTGWNWTCLRIFSSMSLFHWFVKCVLSVNTSIDSAGCALSKVLWLQLDLVSSWAENDRKLVGVSKDGAGAARKFAVTFAVQRLVWSSWNQKSKRSPFQELLIGTSFVNTNTKVLIIDSKVFGSLNLFLKKKIEISCQNKLRFAWYKVCIHSRRRGHVTWLIFHLFIYL